MTSPFASSPDDLAALTSGAREALGSSQLVLASASSRRHQLLGATGLSFLIEPADVDETIDPSLPAGAVAEDLALRKARAVAQRRPVSAEGAQRAGPWILGADTVVVLGEDGAEGREFLEKAADGAEARGMLEALSGTRHRVITGVALVTLDGAGKVVAERTDHEVTWVRMRIISEAEIAAYVASGEWRGKAGGYAIQETADRFVEELDGGGFDNVVGLPVGRTLRLLAAARAG